MNVFNLVNHHLKSVWKNALSSNSTKSYFKTYGMHQKILNINQCCGFIDLNQIFQHISDDFSKYVVDHIKPYLSTF